MKFMSERVNAVQCIDVEVPNEGNGCVSGASIFVNYFHHSRIYRTRRKRMR